MRIVVTSDTHGWHGKLSVPAGDVLIHAGDLTGDGSREELASAVEWLTLQPHQHKLVIAGNHDRCLQDDPAAAEQLTDAGITYLCDTQVTIAGLHFYGSPWQPLFRNMAFNVPRGPALRRIWAQVPAEIDVLITHTPPHGIRDRTFLRTRVGCADLRAELDRIRPRLHVFGHIHESAGTTTKNGTTFINASALNVLHLPSNPPVVFDFNNA